MNCKKSTKRDRKFSGNLHTLYNSQGEILCKIDTFMEK